MAVDRAADPRGYGVYVHVPYCSRKCDYCSFHSITEWSYQAQRGMVDKIVADACRFAEVFAQGGGALNGATATTVYVGGGTPSVLGRGLLTALIDGVTAALGKPAEISCEANPESATGEFLAEAAAAGVTRLSIGVQSLNPQLCQTIGRRPASREQLAGIRAGWSGDLAADLITAIPGQITSDVLRDIQALAEIGFKHIAVYDLAVEPGTPLAQRQKSGLSNACGRVRYPGTRRSQPKWKAVRNALERRDYRRYEVSNFAQPGHEALHNLGYWRGESYLGLGPSATSSIIAGRSGTRIVQPNDHARFLTADPVTDASQEFLDWHDLVVERLMLSLRTREGIRRASFRRQFGTDPVALLGTVVDSLVERELLVVDDRSLAATDAGMDLLDGILLTLIQGVETDAAP